MGEGVLGDLISPSGGAVVCDTEAHFLPLSAELGDPGNYISVRLKLFPWLEMNGYLNLV